MLRSLLVDPSLVVKHRHSDGSWSELEPEPAHHDATQHDPEQGWQAGRVWVCRRCDEQVLIGTEEGDPRRDA